MLTQDQLWGLHENIPRLRAERVLEEARLGRIQLTPDGWYEYTMQATGGRWLGEGKWVGGDQKAAEAAHHAAVKASPEWQNPGGA